MDSKKFELGMDDNSSSVFKNGIWALAGLVTFKITSDHILQWFQKPRLGEDETKVTLRSFTLINSKKAANKEVANKKNYKVFESKELENGNTKELRRDRNTEKLYFIEVDKDGNDILSTKKIYSHRKD